MKKGIMIIVVLLGLFRYAPAQEQNMDNWESTAYCSYGKVHPLSFIRADNNWELLLALRDGMSLKGLDSLGVKYTSSQLYLLYIQDMLSRNNKIWKTSIPLLDSLAAARLRGEGKVLAGKIVRDIAPQTKKLVRYLTENDMSGNSYSILFSYVLDGLIWNKLEQADIIRPFDMENGNWGGLVWFLYPKLQRMQTGTNTYGLDDRAAFVLNWREDAPMAMSSPDSLLRIMRTGEIKLSPELKEKFIQYGYLSPAGKLRVPYILEVKENPIFALSGAIAEQIVRSFLEYANLEQVRQAFGLPDLNAAAIILYHAVLPELADALVEQKIVKMPVLFTAPRQASKAENAAVCFIVDKNI